jgi:hypothetical protein
MRTSAGKRRLFKLRGASERTRYSRGNASEEHPRDNGEAYPED